MPRRRRRTTLWVFTVLALLLPLGKSGVTPAQETGFRVVVHPDNPVTTLTAERVSSLFFKKVKKWDDGTAVQPVDQPLSSPVRGAFTEAILGRSPAQVRSFWQQRIFSGRDLPPPERKTDAEVVAFVGRERGAIGYISTGTSTRGVKIIRVE